MTLALSPADQARLAGFANLAPSVHNTQPARWHFAGDRSIWILADRTRYLPAGDPTRRDAGLSCGAALEATILGLPGFGFETAGVEILWNGSGSSPVPGTDAAARIATRPSAAKSQIAAQISHRFTWRRAFIAATSDTARALSSWVPRRDDFKLTADAAQIAQMSAFNDRASLGFLRNSAFRAELLSWMRLRPTDPRWSIDGLSAEALGMGRLEALGAGIVLRSPVFERLDGLGLSGLVVGEGAKTKSATAIGLFHRPIGESPIATGRAYLDAMLQLSRLGFQTWPMTAIADDPEIAAEVCRLYSISDSHRLVSVLRIGVVPSQAKPARARLDPAQLISSEQL
jgi:hypothetical protein